MFNATTGNGIDNEQLCSGAAPRLTNWSQGAGPQAKIVYHSDGTPATSQSPGAAAGVQTTYGYDSVHNLASITPPAGTSLGLRTYTEDSFGRLGTATDGRGNTITYSYDDADRISLVHHSDPGTADVSYPSYDSLGHVLTRVDASGTTTYTYDSLGKLLTTANTAGGGTITYRYDLAGALASTSDTVGVTTYGYDAAHQLTSMTYPQTGSTLYTGFANDANGRRTDTWLQSNSIHSGWAAHSHTDYDASGRVTRIYGQNGPATAPVTVIDQSTCYAAGAVAPACPTTTSADRANIRWVSDAKSGETITYSYNTDDRLTSAVVTGGTNPRSYTYGYDTAGNRTSSAVTGATPSSQTLSFNNANQITSSGYAYDGAGNQTATPTRSATYNSAGQTTSTTKAGKTTTYTYAGTNQNELTSQSTAGGNTYRYTYGRSDRNGLPVIEEVQYNTLNGYVFHDPSGLAVMLQTSHGTTCLYVYDGRNNPTGLLTSYSAISFIIQFDPYGAGTRTDGTIGNAGIDDNPYTYGGGLQDRATGNIKFGTRWYDPTTGTYTQQDTLNAPLDPHNANRYQYAAANPINNTDPTGRDDVTYANQGTASSPPYNGGGGPISSTECTIDIAILTVAVGVIATPISSYATSAIYNVGSVAGGYTLQSNFC